MINVTGKIQKNPYQNYYYSTSNDLAQTLFGTSQSNRST